MGSGYGTGHGVGQGLGLENPSICKKTTEEQVFHPVGHWRVNLLLHTYLLVLFI